MIHRTTLIRLLSTSLLLVWISSHSSAAEIPAPQKKLPAPAASIPDNYRKIVLDVMNNPTVAVQSEEQTFHAEINHYMFMLDHPDRTAKAWRRLGVPALNISGRPDGQHRWKDGNGTELVWRKLVHNEHGLIWYAHGRANPGRLLPNVPGRAVAVLWHQSGKDDDDRTIIRHKLDLYVQTDSRAAKMLTRIVGPTAPTIAQNGANQLLTFFSGVARYLEKHPKRAEELLAP